MSKEGLGAHTFQAIKFDPTADALQRCQPEISGLFGCNRGDP